MDERKIIPIDHVHEGTERLSDNLTKENIVKILSIFLKKVNECEQAFVDLANQKSIELAEGVWLDYIGSIVGVTRQGRDDETYRKELLFKVSVNTADATPNIITDIVRTFTESEGVEIWRSGTAHFQLFFNGKINTDSELHDLVKRIRPAGVSYTICSDYYDNAFRLAYEQIVANTEEIQITRDGNFFENLQVTLDNVVFEDLFISLLGSAKFEQTSLREGFNEFYYEQPVNLQVTTDGVNFEDLELVVFSEQPEQFLLHNDEELLLTIDEGVEDVYQPSGVFVPELDYLKVMTPYLEDYTEDNIITLAWEVEPWSLPIED